MDYSKNKDFVTLGSVEDQMLGKPCDLHPPDTLEFISVEPTWCAGLRILRDAQQRRRHGSFPAFRQHIARLAAVPLGLLKNVAHGGVAEPNRRALHRRTV